MIEINLLPGSGKKKASKRQGIDVKALLAGLNSRAKDKFLIAAVASSIVAIAAIGVLYTAQAARESRLNSELNKAVADSTRYAQVVRERVRAESIRDTLLRQVNLIKSIDEDRYIWPHIMDELSRALPQYTWIMQVAYTGVPQGSNNVVALPKPSKEDSMKAAKSGKPVKLVTEVPRDNIGIVLRGQTVDIQALTRYMKELEASPFIGSVTLERSELAVGAGGKEVTAFQLTLGYTRPDTLSIRRAPMSLASGGR